MDIVIYLVVALGLIGLVVWALTRKKQADPVRDWANQEAPPQE